MSLRSSSRRLVPLRYTLRLTTPRLLVGGFAAAMALGTLLLKLPASTQGGISWIDAFFVSVSAVSVTRLSTVDFPDTFTSFGGAVVMALIQVGGLGIMTLATLGALVVGNRGGFRSILSVREELGTIDSPRNTLALVGQIAAFTLVLELVGAVLLSVGFLRRGLGVGEGIFQGVFHAIMALRTPCLRTSENLSSTHFVNKGDNKEWEPHTLGLRSGRGAPCSPSTADNPSGWMATIPSACTTPTASRSRLGSSLPSGYARSE